MISTQERLLLEFLHRWLRGGREDSDYGISVNAPDMSVVRSLPSLVAKGLVEESKLGYFRLTENGNAAATGLYG